MNEAPAREALMRLEPLVGTWRVQAAPPGGEPWPREGRVTIEWHDSRAHLVERTTPPPRSAPASVAIMGCDAAAGTYVRLHSDERGVYRVYQMRIDDREWRLWRDDAPFAQRFSATIAEDGDTLTGRWEKALDGEKWEIDFELTYHRIR